MIDLRLLRDEPDTVRASQRARGEDDALVDAALAADALRRSTLAEFEQLRAEQKSAGREVATAAREQKQSLVVRARELSTRVKAAEAAAAAAAQELDGVLRLIPNLVDEGVPVGGEDASVVLREVGTPRDHAVEGFATRDHLEVAEGLRAVDTARGAKVSGARFYFLTGIGARLELALLTLALDRAEAAGFTPMVTPTLVRPEVMAGTGFLGEHADEVYRLEADDLYLVGTSEVALAGLHADEILDLGGGGMRYAGWSTCYRREAGSYGKDTRGIIRVHQFNKVELFCYVPVEDAAAEHARLLAFEEDILAALELPYRVLDVAAGDLGSSAARKFDCEAWLPSQQRYLELTSTSSCTTYQSRRLGIRERTDRGTRPVATLNGTAGTTRWIVALLENHQQADGAVHVPPVLRPYLGGRELLTPSPT